jgi:hypothetical protein
MEKQHALHALTVLRRGVGCVFWSRVLGVVRPHFAGILRTCRKARSLFGACVCDVAIGELLVRDSVGDDARDVKSEVHV